MDSFRSTGKLSIQVENDSLVMFGTSLESAGCVLRGALQFSLTQPLKVKSISVRFIGKSIFTWSEPLGNGEKLYHEEVNNILDETYTCLPRQSKLHHLQAGEHKYDFEFILRGSLPETTCVANFYQVDYKLKATIERPAFLKNQIARRSIHLARQLFSPFSPEFMEPVHMIKRCENNVEMLVTMPTKIYAFGDSIPLTVHVACLHSHLKLKLLSCNLKEYIILGDNVASKIDERSRAHGRHLFSTKVTQFNTTTILPTTSDFSYLLSSLSSNESIDHLWTKQFNIALPSNKNEMHCDIGNSMVRVKHKFKFILDVHNSQTGENIQLRLAVPINICALSLNTNELPPYEESSSNNNEAEYHPILSTFSSFSSIPPLSQNDSSSPLLLSSIQNNRDNNGLPTYQDIVHRNNDRLPSYDEQVSTLTAY